MSAASFNVFVSKHERKGTTMTETTATEAVKGTDAYEAIIQAKLDDEGNILNWTMFAIVKKADASRAAARLQYERPRSGWVYLIRAPMYTGQIVAS
jgi:hypothetical protein